jgi:hypothetical protein
MVDTLRLVLLPLYVLMIAQIFLGKRLFHYWRRSGWIVALGMASLTGVLVLQVCVTFALSMRVG